MTIVLHNAWKMDFNTPVNEFDHDCLQGTIHIMRFANTSKRKTFAFSSSVATHLGPAAAGKEVAEAEISNEPSLALNTGYAESKFIVEMLTQTLARHLEMSVKVFRIGQLCGNSLSGAWNKTEMFPIMIMTGLDQLNAMPVLDQHVDWLPVDVCASSISTPLTIEASPSNVTADRRSNVHNLVNPAVTSWARFLDVLGEASGTSFERIPMTEWVARLQALSEHVSDVLGARLLGFFEDMAHSESAPSPIFSTTLTQQLVPKLASARATDVALM